MEKPLGIRTKGSLTETQGRNKSVTGPCPPSAYTTRGGVGTVAAAERAKWLMEEDEPSEPETQDEEVTASAKDEDDSGEAPHSEAAEDGRIAA